MGENSMKQTLYTVGYASVYCVDVENFQINPSFEQSTC